MQLGFCMCVWVIYQHVLPGVVIHVVWYLLCRMASDEQVQHWSGGHAESIEGMEWSPNSAWIFASLSYEGKVCIGRVPAKEKYRILF